jgi:sulfur relay (sulfurtransferase) DsrC/TusE family protein
MIKKSKKQTGGEICNSLYLPWVYKHYKNKNMIKACLFDLDGVIVDTAKYHYIAWREIAKELGFDFTEQHNERLRV